MFAMGVLLAFVASYPGVAAAAEELAPAEFEAGLSQQVFESGQFSPVALRFNFGVPKVEGVKS
jgi:hypothetical protein